MDSHFDIRIRRSTHTIFLASLVLLVVHVTLCHPAATSRGDLVHAWFWERWGLFLCYAGVPLFSLLNDRTAWRRAGMATFMMPALLVTSVALSNVQAARPRPGFSLGMSGLLRDDFVSASFLALLLAAIVVPLALMLDAIAVKLWVRHRAFIDEDSTSSLAFSVRSLLVVTTLVALLATGVALLRK